MSYRGGASSRFLQLADDALCIKDSSILALAKCPKQFQARLRGPLIDEIRTFAVILVNDELMVADIITGTIYDSQGRHNNSSVLRIEDVPVLRMKDSTEVVI